MVQCWNQRVFPWGRPCAPGHGPEPPAHSPSAGRISLAPHDSALGLASPGQGVGGTWAPVALAQEHLPVPAQGGPSPWASAPTRYGPGRRPHLRGAPALAQEPATRHCQGAGSLASSLWVLRPMSQRLSLSTMSTIVESPCRQEAAFQVGNRFHLALSHWGGVEVGLGALPRPQLPEYLRGSGGCVSSHGSSPRVRWPSNIRGPAWRGVAESLQETHRCHHPLPVRWPRQSHGLGCEGAERSYSGFAAKPEGLCRCRLGERHKIQISSALWAGPLHSAHLLPGCGGLPTAGAMPPLPGASPGPPKSKSADRPRGCSVLFRTSHRVETPATSILIILGGVVPAVTTARPFSPVVVVEFTHPGHFNVPCHPVRSVLLLPSPACLRRGVASCSSVGQAQRVVLFHAAQTTIFGTNRSSAKGAPRSQMVLSVECSHAPSCRN